MSIAVWPVYIRYVEKFSHLHLALFIALSLNGAVPSTAQTPVKLLRGGGNLQIVSSRLRVECDLSNGRTTYRWSNGAVISGVARRLWRGW